MTKDIYIDGVLINDKKILESDSNLDLENKLFLAGEYDINLTDKICLDDSDTDLTMERLL